MDAARAGAIPGGLKNNLEFASCAVEAAKGIDAALLQLLYDPQTSGGLLISLPEDEAAALEAAIPGARRIGRVVARDNKPIRLE
jgi:selenide,water dikinase